MVFSNGLNKRTHFSKGKIKMEIIIIIAVLIGLLWWFFLRTPADVVTHVPNKVEAPTVSDPAPILVESTVELATVAVTTVTTEIETAAATPVVVSPAKKPRKPRAPKAVVPAEKPAAKKAAPVKKAAAIKAAPKARTPRSKKA